MEWCQSLVKEVNEYVSKVNEIDQILNNLMADIASQSIYADSQMVTNSFPVAWDVSIAGQVRQITTLDIVTMRSTYGWGNSEEKKKSDLELLQNWIVTSFHYYA